MFKSYRWCNFFKPQSAFVIAMEKIALLSGTLGDWVSDLWESWCPRVWFVFVSTINSPQLHLMYKWTKELSGLLSMGSQEPDTISWLNHYQVERGEDVHFFFLKMNPFFKKFSWFTIIVSGVQHSDSFFFFCKGSLITLLDHQQLVLVHIDCL